jgi:hypothetical protein
MSSITGIYRCPDKTIDNWVINWMYRPADRDCLADQLRQIRQRLGRREAKEFRNYLLWIGCYPKCGLSDRSRRELRGNQSVLRRLRGSN